MSDEIKNKWEGHNVPDEVQKIFDDAEANAEHTAVVFTKDSVQLTLADGRTVLKEVKWEGVNDFARIFLKNVMGYTLENEPAEIPAQVIHHD